MPLFGCFTGGRRSARSRLTRRGFVGRFRNVGQFRNSSGSFRGGSEPEEDFNNRPIELRLGGNAPISWSSLLLPLHHFSPSHARACARTCAGSRCAAWVLGQASRANREMAAWSPDRPGRGFLFHLKGLEGGQDSAGNRCSHSSAAIDSVSISLNSRGTFSPNLSHFLKWQQSCGRSWFDGGSQRSAVHVDPVLNV